MSKAKQHENPLENPVTRKQLKKLTAEWGGLNVVQRAVCLKALNERGCNDHELGRALKVDHKTISRYRRIAELPEEQRARIAQGESAASFLKAQGNRAEVARSGQPKTRNPHKPDAGKLIQESRPEPGLGVKQDQIEPLLNTVQQMEKRISTIEASQESILRGLNQDAASKAFSGEREKVSTKREAPRGPHEFPPEMLEKHYAREEKRKIVLPEKQRRWF